ncbi:helix-turn-helix domain-containing protein [Rhodococcus sp. NPDC058514]|uniref:helix-turn-helix domain-containing protein n=1 Tax=unclassified Rhodococcus (in: high G+C Gram-positive bacteria) TaxID=192944 RepID=UPI0036505D4A
MTRNAARDDANDGAKVYQHPTATRAQRGGYGYRAQSWALSLDLPSSQKLVLLVLAGRADRYYSAWPSVPTLTNETGLSARTVRYALDGLETADLLIRARRIDPDSGRTTSTRYYLNAPDAPHMVDGIDPADVERHTEVADAIARAIAVQKNAPPKPWMKGKRRATT